MEIMAEKYVKVLINEKPHYQVLIMVFDELRWKYFDELVWKYFDELVWKYKVASHDLL